MAAIIECDSAREFSITYQFTEITMLCPLAGRENTCWMNGLRRAHEGLSAYPVAVTRAGYGSNWLALERMGLVMSDETTGTVKWFNDAKGYGFISGDDGTDLFVHFKSIKGNGFRSLKEGQKVKFQVKQGPKGLQAEGVESV
jgi:CspA family cold shock protein